MLKLNPCGPNMTELETDKATILFSYKTPVAALIPGKGWIRTDRFYSNTTSKHINRWLGSVASSNSVVETVPQATLDALTN